MVSFHRCNRCFNSVDNFSSRICVSVLNKTEDVNLNVLNMTTRINASKVLKKKFYMVFNVRLILEKLIQIKNEIKNCLDVISYRNSSACEVDKYLKSIIQ